VATTDSPAWFVKDFTAINHVWLSANTRAGMPAIYFTASEYEQTEGQTTAERPSDSNLYFHELIGYRRRLYYIISYH
jgi:hypothetical protein